MKWLAVLLFPLVATVAQAQPVLEQDLPLAYLAQGSTNTAAQPLMILLHGSGSNEEDLFGLCAELAPQATCLSVRAPLEVGEGRYQWFRKTDGEGPYEGVPDEVQRSLDSLRAFIAQAQAKYRVAPGRTYLVGFSQGAMMSYEVALHDPFAVGGMAALSGKLNADIRDHLASAPGLSRLPVFIGHGTADSVLPYGDATQANEVLLKVGVKAAFHAYPGMGHGVSEAEVDDLRRWLLQVMGQGEQVR
jgi:phospholipase/carboxylesterase